MQNFIDNIGGQGYASALMWTIAALVLLLVVLVAIKIIKNFTFGTFVSGGRNRKARLAVIDATAVDSSRRLVLVRRDDVEHLILIGGHSDLVIEGNIRSADATAERMAPSPQRAPEPLPRQEERAPRDEPRAPVPPLRVDPRSQRPTDPEPSREPVPAPSPPTLTSPAPAPSSPPLAPAPVFAAPAPATRPQADRTAASAAPIRQPQPPSTPQPPQTPPSPARAVPTPPVSVPRPTVPQRPQPAPVAQQVPPRPAATISAAPRITPVVAPPAVATPASQSAPSTRASVAEQQRLEPELPDTIEFDLASELEDFGREKPEPPKKEPELSLEDEMSRLLSELSGRR